MEKKKGLVDDKKNDGDESKKSVACGLAGQMGKTNSQEIKTRGHGSQELAASTLSKKKQTGGTRLKRSTRTEFGASRKESTNWKGFEPVGSLKKKLRGTRRGTKQTAKRVEGKKPT